MKKRTALLTAILILAMSCIGCDGKTAVSYAEPSTDGENYAWLDGTPLAQFGAPAEDIVVIDVAERTMSADVRQLISSLKAVVNGTQVRLFTNDSENDTARGWLDRLGYSSGHRLWEYTDPWEVVWYFQDEIGDVVVYDTANLYTLDLACTYAGLHDCLTVSYPVYAELKARGFDVRIQEDYRGRFADKYAAYEYLYETLWNDCTHKVLISEHVDYTGYVRSYGMLIRAAFVYLDVREERDAVLMEKFLSEMPAGESCIYGWYASESSGVDIASRHGVWTYAADFLQNAEFFAHKTELVLPSYTESFTQPADVDGDTVYVALIVSEGDNLAYDMNALYSSLFSSQKLGAFPVSFSISPSMAVTLPELLNWYYRRANDNVGFMTGPSGVGYTYVNSWTDEPDGLERFFRTTNRYCKLAGIEVVNNWTAGGSWGSRTLSDEVRALMERCYTDVLCVADNGANTRTSANNLLITGMQVGYTYADESIADIFGAAIEQAVAETERYREPTFVWLQGNPWAGNILDEYEALIQSTREKYGDRVSFVRVDQLARAQRLFNGLSATR